LISICFDISVLKTYASCIPIIISNTDTGIFENSALLLKAEYSSTANKYLPAAVRLKNGRACEIIGSINISENYRSNIFSGPGGFA
jgi:hypothetical protein